MNKFRSVVLWIIIMNTMASAEFKFVGDIKNVKELGNKIEFLLSNALLIVYVVDNNIIRFRYTQKESFSQAPSYAVTEKETTKTKFNFNDEGDYYQIKTSELIVKISKSPCRVSIYDKQNNLINEDSQSFGVAFDGNDIRCFKKLLSNERFFGLGEKTGNLNKKGNQYTMWNTDHPAYQNTSDPLYQSIPFFIGERNYKSYGIFFDNSYKSYFNMGASNNRFYWFGAEGGEMNYYFIYGPSMKKVIESYTSLTGRMSLPPKMVARISAK